MGDNNKKFFSPLQYCSKLWVTSRFERASKSIIGNFDASMLRLYRRIGCEVEVLGSTLKYGLPVYLGLHPISEPIIRRIKAKLKNTELAFAARREMAAA